MDWYLKVLKNHFNFRDRARRREYWWFVLVNAIITILLGFVQDALGWSNAEGEGALTIIYGLLLLIPSIAVMVRRLHDTDRSGWWVLIGLIPIVGWFVLIIFAVFDSQPGTNRFGPNPKDIQAPTSSIIS